MLTHGDHDDVAAPSLASFLTHVDEQPADGYLLCDGGGIPEIDWPWRRGATDSNTGFCRATGALWAIAAQSECENVFWLEHDFVFLRHLQISALAEVLEQERGVAQMALMRNAVNVAEIMAGGLYESRPGQWTARGDWLEQTSYFTTNPSLMRSGFMRDNPWPLYLKNCEGRFGIDLLQAGYRFGVWGGGEVWCEHIGIRDGSGY